MNPVESLEVTPFDYGGAVAIRWINPTDAAFDHVQIVRKTTNDISGPNDLNAINVFTGTGNQIPEFQSIINRDPLLGFGRYRQITDTSTVVGGTVYFYAVFATDLSGVAFSVAANATAKTPTVGELCEPDIMAVLSAYLTQHFSEQVAAGGLSVKAGHVVRVVDAPPRLDRVSFPVVSVHLDSDEPIEYAIGDVVRTNDMTGDVVEKHRGYLSKVTFSIVGWAGDNPAVRRSLYRVIKGAMIGARELLSSYGVVNMSLSGRYDFNAEEYGMPMYSAVFTQSGDVTSSVRIGDLSTIKTIDVNGPTVSAANLAC